MKATKQVNNQIIPFKGYWIDMNAEERKAFLEKTRGYISNSNMYTAIRNNKFTKLQQFYLESILERQFDWA